MPIGAKTNGSSKNSLNLDPHAGGKTYSGIAPFLAPSRAIDREPSAEITSLYNQLAISHNERGLSCTRTVIMAPERKHSLYGQSMP